jgi:hypothetical protein
VALPNPSLLDIDSDDLVALQLNLDYRQRKALAPDFARRVGQFAATLGVTAPNGVLGGMLAAELEDRGYARLGAVLSPGAVADVLAHFAQRPVFGAHIHAHSDGIAHTLEELESTMPFACFRQQDVVTAPHVLEIANDPTILDAVGSYLGCPPTLYSMNAWWSFPRPGGAAVITQGFHRDEDDLKNCVLFLYLTDVGADGCHEYIRHSHNPQELKRRLGGQDVDALFQGIGYREERAYRELLGALIDPIEGNAGEGFLSDPDGLHRARQPETDRRLIVWLRYGLHRNRAYIQDKLWPVPRARVAGRLPDTARARFVNRLVVEPE